MDADYSIEIGGDAPALELPWQDPEGLCEYFDLRVYPEKIADLPEVRRFPALGKALHLLNAAPSPWQTAKCDAWEEACDPMENLHNANYVAGSYLDLVLASEKRQRAGLAAHKRLAEAIVARIEELGAEDEEATAQESSGKAQTKLGAALGNMSGAQWSQSGELTAEVEIVVRACFFHGTPKAELEAGHALTLFVSGYGATAEEAVAMWAKALAHAVHCALAEAEAQGEEVG